MNSPEQQPSPREEQIETQPFVSGVCQFIAWASLVLGAAITFFAVADIARPGYATGVAVGLVIIFGSIFWFALARVILLLARIAYNTRRS